MSRFSSKHYLIIAGVSLLIGWLFALLMTVKLVPSSYWLNLITFLLMLLGMFTGFWGMFNYVKARRDKLIAAQREIPEEYRADLTDTKRN